MGLPCRGYEAMGEVMRGWALHFPRALGGSAMFFTLPPYALVGRRNAGPGSTYGIRRSIKNSEGYVCFFFFEGARLA